MLFTLSRFCVDMHRGWDGEGTGSDDVQRRKGMAEATQRALRQNTELNGRVAALTEAIQVRELLPIFALCLRRSFFVEGKPWLLPLSCSSMADSFTTFS